MLKSVLFDEKDTPLPQTWSGDQNSNQPKVGRTQSLEFFDSATIKTNDPFLNQGPLQFEPSNQLNEYEPVIDPIPLLEELEIDFRLIWKNLRFVLNPFSDKSLTSNELDLTGSLVICMLLGFVLLLKGKVQFSSIYGVGSMGSLLIYMLLNLMNSRGASGHQICSVLGYCLLPMIFLGLLSIFVPMLRLGVTGLAVSSIFIAWSTWSSAGMFVSALDMQKQKFLVAYPVGLLYITFAMLCVF